MTLKPRRKIADPPEDVLKGTFKENCRPLKFREASFEDSED